jgi:hypothetical protein
MQEYIILYHYSPAANLSKIDPGTYGTGISRISECKRGKSGADKSFYYTEDKPEVIVRSGARCYVVYMPKSWQDQIYDISEDRLALHDRVRDEIHTRYNREPYLYELRDAVEEKIKSLGFKGWRASGSELPHVIALFPALQTAKPDCEFAAYDWHGALIEENRHCEEESNEAFHAPRRGFF